MKNFILIMCCIACSHITFGQTSPADDLYGFGYFTHDSSNVSLDNVANECQNEIVNWQYYPAEGASDINAPVYFEITTPSGQVDNCTFLHPDTYSYTLEESGLYEISASVNGFGLNDYTLIVTEVPEILPYSYSTIIYVTQDLDFVLPSRQCRMDIRRYILH